MAAELVGYALHKVELSNSSGPYHLQRLAKQLLASELQMIPSLVDSGQQQLTISSEECSAKANITLTKHLKFNLHTSKTEPFVKTEALIGRFVVDTAKTRL